MPRTGRFFEADLEATGAVPYQSKIFAVYRFKLQRISSVCVQNFCDVARVQLRPECSENSTKPRRCWVCYVLPTSRLFVQTSGSFILRQLMDMKMPVMDGLQAARVIRELPGMTALPILALTASAFPTERDQCLSAGMNGHIEKPVEPAAFYATLLQWLHKSQSLIPPR